MSAFDKPTSALLDDPDVIAAIAAKVSATSTGPSAAVDTALPGELRLVPAVPAGYTLVAGAAPVVVAGTTTPAPGMNGWNANTNYSKLVLLADGTAATVVNSIYAQNTYLMPLISGAWGTIPLPFAYSQGGPFATAALNDGRMILAQAEIGAAAPTYLGNKYGNWSNIGTNPDSMGQSVAARLGSGKILFVGGVSTSVGDRSPICSVYTPDQGFARSPFPYIQAISGAAATELPDGTVLVAGGYGAGGGITNVCAIYSENTGWTQVASLPVALGFASLATVGNFTYLIGGRKADGTGNRQVYVFSHDTKTWGPGDDLTQLTPGAGTAAVGLPDGRVLFEGGSDSAPPTYLTPGVTNYYVRKNT